MGSTHQSVEDIAYMRAIPGMVVICPADANETVEATKALAKYHGPAYLRLNRNDYENVTPEGKPFEIGVPTMLRDGGDVVIFATGYMVGLSLAAAKELEGELSVRVVNVSTIKPLNSQKIAQLTEGCRGVVTAEEHSVIGGLGSAIAEVLRRSGKPIEFVGIEDTFGCSGHNYAEVLQYHGLTVEHIVQAVRSIARQG